MPTSVREQLLSAILTATGGEYGLPAPESERDLPITIVRDPEPDEATTDVYNQTNVLMTISVFKGEAATSAHRDTMRAQADELLAGIITAMFVDETFGELADGVEYTAGGIQTEVGQFCLAEAQFAVRYHHVRGDPYTIDE